MKGHLVQPEKNMRYARADRFGLPAIPQFDRVVDERYKFMLKKLSSGFYKISSTWVVLLSALIFLIFMVAVLPGQAAQAALYSAGTGSPDTTWLYSSTDLVRMAQAYGATGRKAYIQARFSFDLAFPLVYASFLTLSISWLFSRALAAVSRWRLLNLAPLTALLLDLLENISAVRVMALFPEPAPAALLLAPIFSVLKWLAVCASFALLPFALVLFYRNKFRKAGNQYVEDNKNN